MNILLVVDKDDYAHVIGYYHNGKVYGKLEDIPLRRKTVDTNPVYVDGVGVVDLDALRQQRLEQARTQTIVEARLTLDPMIRSLRGL